MQGSRLTTARIWTKNGAMAPNTGIKCCRRHRISFKSKPRQIGSGRILGDPSLGVCVCVWAPFSPNPADGPSAQLSFDPQMYPAATSSSSLPEGGRPSSNAVTIALARGALTGRQPPGRRRPQARCADTRTWQLRRVERGAARWPRSMPRAVGAGPWGPGGRGGSFHAKPMIC